MSRKPFILDDDIADVVRGLVEAFDNGEVGKVLVIYQKPDQTILSRAAGFGGLEKYGLGKMIQEDQTYHWYHSEDS